jgi:hypothetical protein
LITPETRDAIRACTLAELIDNIAAEHVRVAGMKDAEPRDREASREFRKAIMTEIDHRLNDRRLEGRRRNDRRS